MSRLHARGAGRGEVADGPGPHCRRWSTSLNGRSRTLPSTAYCWCMHWKWRTIRPRFSARSGGCWPPADSCLRWCRTAAGCGPVRTRRRSGTGRPYSRSQITSLMRDAWFTPIGWSEAALTFRRFSAAGSTHDIGLGARRLGHLGAVRGRAHCRGHQAGLSRHSGQAREATLGAGAQPCAPRWRRLPAGRPGKFHKQKGGHRPGLFLVAWRRAQSISFEHRIKVRHGGHSRSKNGVAFRSRLCPSHPRLELQQARRGCPRQARA